MSREPVHLLAAQQHAEQKHMDASCLLIMSWLWCQEAGLTCRRPKRFWTELCE